MSRSVTGSTARHNRTKQYKKHSPRNNLVFVVGKSVVVRGVGVVVALAGWTFPAARRGPRGG